MGLELSGTRADAGVHVLEKGASARSQAIYCYYALAVLGVLPAVYFGLRRFFGGRVWWPLPRPDLLPVGIGFVGVALPFVLFGYRRASTTRWRRWVDERLISNRAARWTARTCAAVMGGGLLAHWRKTVGLVGDAEVWTPLASKWFIFASEPLGRWLHYFAYHLLAFFGHPSNEAAVRLPSYCAGAFFLLVALFTVPTFVPAGRSAATVACLFLTPVSIFFFGYPSTCPFAYAFVGAYFLMGLRYLTLRPRRAPWPESVLMSFAVWTHGMALFATSAQAALVLLWLFHWPPATNPAGKLVRGATALLLGLIPFALLGATFWWTHGHGSGLPGYSWMGNAGGGIFHRTWIKFSGGTNTWGRPGGILFEQFEFLGRDYDIGLLNLILWLCPALLLAPLAIRWRLHIDRPSATFLGAGLCGLLVLTFFWNPDWGYETDMRLLSLFALPTNCLVFTWLANSLEARLWTIVSSVAAASAFAFILVPYLAFP